ncbi:hypothetical protein TOPH_02786 [Tolypocladium ophioglossoides CBS 100239]|uniref:Uncharacterized protein n=1 Tax=Tolypocladium ophioglossoides (strain CBS 100239) TaxID=1163406 RepID=A0A0L0NF39_TOLOC|nr:hypothetical protein TOPH_02786 [Tolypocladium ophioglossoides CBS 100239]
MRLRLPPDLSLLPISLTGHCLLFRSRQVLLCCASDLRPATSSSFGFPSFSSTQPQRAKDLSYASCDDCPGFRTETPRLSTSWREDFISPPPCRPSSRDTHSALNTLTLDHHRLLASSGFNSVMAASSSQSSLPQGFSVYQPALGAQLQFLPALGSQQLDDLINAYVPGPAAISEKRASVSVDFLGYAQLTGQTFKFYPVHAAASVAASPVAASPSLDSASSSFNVSPVTSSWDWSAAASVSSRSSTQRRRHCKVTSPSSRHQTAIDFSSLPGMKILTKDGVDVTNSASRGSKTKEQRDHAHLMRIIKACDSCRRKKIRCDPSHKKRAAQASAQPAAAGAVGPKPSKKQRTLPQAQPPPQAQGSALPSTTVVDGFASFSGSGSFDLDSPFDFSGLESLDAAVLPCDPWEEFVQFPPMDITEDYDFFLDPENYFSSQSSASSLSASPFKALTPQSHQEPGAPPGADNAGDEILRSRSPQYPFLDQPSSSGTDYAAFNLFSPESSFSEDDRMLPIGSSSSSLLSLNEPLISECPPPSPPPGRDIQVGGDGAVGGRDATVASAEVSQFSAADDLGGIDYYDPGLQRGESSNRDGSSGIEPTRESSESLGGEVVICCAPGTAVLTPGGSSGRVLNNVSTSLNITGSSLARSATNGSPVVAVQNCVAATATSAHRHDQSSLSSLYEQDLHVQPASRRSEAVPSYGPEPGFQGLDTSRERATESEVTTAGSERVTVSRVAPTRESIVQPSIEPSFTDSPGQPSASRGAEARHISLASLEVLQTTSVDQTVVSAVSRVVALSPDQNHSATPHIVDITVPSTAVWSARDGAVDLNEPLGVNSAINSATSNPSHVRDPQSPREAAIDTSSLETRLLSVAAVNQQGHAAQTSRAIQTIGKSVQTKCKTALGGLALAFVTAAILLAFVLYKHSDLTSASTSAYMLGAMLALASQAMASATTSRPTEQKSPLIKTNSSQFSEATSAILDLPGRTRAAARSHVSWSISQGSTRAFPIMTFLKG